MDRRNFLTVTAAAVAAAAAPLAASPQTASPRARFRTGEIAEGWRRWATHPDAWYAVLHGEILCRA